MSEGKFTVGEAIGFGWGVTKKHFWSLIGIYLITNLILAVPQILEKFNVISEGESLYFVINIIFWALSIIISMGLIKISLNLVDTDEEKPKLRDAFLTYRPAIRFVVSSIVICFMVFIGLILLIVPGIIIALRLQFAFLFIIDLDLGPIEAIKRSWQITRGVGWKLFLFFLASLGLLVLGTVALLLGLLVVTPIIAIAMAYIYRQLVLKNSVNQPINPNEMITA